MTIGVLLTCWIPTGAARAKVFLTREQALELAFGREADVSRETAYLSEEQLDRARSLAGPGIDVRTAMIPRYVGRRDGRVLGTAYFDTHVVRTLRETIMVVVSVDGTVARVDVLTFAEPEDYKPRPAWLDQFSGRGLDENLAIKQGIHGITGATLSADAATDAIRRVLAIHDVLDGETEP
jgi:hypothetical protein